MVVVIEEDEEQIVTFNNTQKNHVEDVSEGFETADDNSTDDDDVNHQTVVIKDDSYHDALTDDQLKEKALAQANAEKSEGNELFKDGKYEDALLKYESALQVAPEIEKHEPAGSPPQVAPEGPKQESVPQVAPGMTALVELRSICHSNRATCFFKLGKYDETVKECSKALELNSAYVKALARRGEAYEKLERFEEAISDMKKILELDPSNYQARRNIVRLEPLAREKMEKMKEEMMGKLKDMGNSILGRFGMSVDNFKAVQDPKTGSYSINFQR